MTEVFIAFKDMDREEKLELINHALDGRVIEIRSEHNPRWNDSYANSRNGLKFKNNHSYRIYKSELELLTEERDNLDKKIAVLGGGKFTVGDIITPKHGLNVDFKEGGTYTLEYNTACEGDDKEFFVYDNVGSIHYLTRDFIIENFYIIIVNKGEQS